MTSPYLLSSSTLVQVPPDVAYDALLAAPLAELFPRRATLIPAVQDCTGQVGPWGTVGQTRTVVLADGTSNRETLVGADRPGLYRYRLSDFTGPMKALVAGVDGKFSFVAEGSGTRVTWGWSIQPTHTAARLALPVIGLSWRQYATRMWPLYAARLT